MSSGSRYRRKKTRLAAGATLAEMPLALWIFLFCIVFPMIVLVSVTMRLAFFWNAAREASQAASRCQTFDTNPPTGGLSAINQAVLSATNASYAFSGITLNSVMVYIIVTPISSGGIGSPQTMPANAKLIGTYAPADPSANMYEIRVELNGTVAPLIQGGLANMPFLTRPFPIQVESQRVCENPEGLDK